MTEQQHHHCLRDVFNVVHHGKRLIPKSILLPLLIKSLTSNTKFITTISRLGHGASYMRLGEIIPELANCVCVCGERGLLIK